MRALRLASVLAASALAGTVLVTAPACASFRDSAPHPAVVNAMLTGSKEEVHTALLQALSTWKIRKDSLEEGIVKTEWAARLKGDQHYQGRIVAEFTVQGYQTALSIKHEKQHQEKAMKTSVGGAAPGWDDVTGDSEVAQAVLNSVRDALGQGEEKLEIGKRPPSPSRPIEINDCIVAPDAAARINDLKSRRKDLVLEVKAMDQQILSAVYDGKYDSIKDDVEKLKARKAMMEDQVTAIDREILALVVAD